jgi:type II secretory pathway component GspD/PulD (secretin)
MQEMRIMRSQVHFSLLGTTLLTDVFLCLLFVSAPGPAWATTSAPFTFENADIQTVVKQVATLTGITFVFDPEQVKGHITLLSPKSVSPTQALDLLKSALALHGYTLVSRVEGTWIVRVQTSRPRGHQGRPAQLCSGWGAGVYPVVGRAALGLDLFFSYYPTNSLVISGCPAAVEELVGVIK